MMNRNTIRQAANVVAVLAVIVVNGLANALPLNGRSTGSISDSFQVFFVPAGYVFSIWGLIYLGLIAFVVYQALPSQREAPRLLRVGYWFAGSCLANIAWLFCWHALQFPLTVLLMLALLLSLIVIYLRLEIGRSTATRAETWCVRVPFSIYLGWITVATVANVTVLLTYWHWSGWGLRPELWAVFMLLAATAIAAVMSLTRGDVAYVLVLVWAFVGIALKQASAPLVAGAAWALAAALLPILAGGVVLRRRQAVGRASR
jgi:translocator protein